MNHWKIITNNLKKAGWRFGCISSTDHKSREFWVVATLTRASAAHRLRLCRAIVAVRSDRLNARRSFGLAAHLYHFVIAVWRAKVGNRIAKATAKEIECLFAEPAIGCQLSPFMLVSINVPLEPPDQQYWQAAVGYVELGMFQDANDQLEKIDPFNRAAPEVLAVRLAIYRGLKKWELMQQIAKRLKQFEPDNVQWTISLAYATRRAYSIDVAMEILLDAEAKFPREAAIPYNLACYYCQLGEMEKAKRYLKEAFEIDLNWRKAALDDEDLRPFWDSLQTTVE